MQIAYADLRTSSEPELADVTLESTSYPTGRGGRVAQYSIGLHSRSASGKIEHHLLDFRGKRLGYSQFSNRHELIATFLRGVLRFRPDLQIDPAILSNYYIDPATGSYDSKARIRAEVFGTVLAILIMAAIFPAILFMV